MTLEPQYFQSPNLQAVDLTMGQRWMQREITRLGIKPEGYTNMGFLESNIYKLRPHIIGNFRNAPFRDQSFSLVLLDPPFTTKTQTKGSKVPSFNFSERAWRLGAYKDARGSWNGTTKYGAFLNLADMELAIVEGLKESYRILKEGGLCIFKWGNTTKGLDWALALRPRGLRVDRIYQRGSKGGGTKWTWFVWLRKDSRGLPG